MTRYLISFPSSAMGHIPMEDFPAVGDAAHAVVREIRAAGAYVFSGGLNEEAAPAVVAADGSLSADTYRETKELNGGFTLIEVASREEALAWAAKIATACRCAQEVREFMDDPEM